MEHNVHVFTMLIVGVHVCLSSVTVDPNSCGTGLCCSNYKPEGDRCIECSPGKYGANCSKHCKDGLYGHKCRNNCSSECKNTCDKVSGVCPGQSQVHISDQNSQQLNGLRYEIDSVFSNNSSTLQLPPRVYESNTTRKEDAPGRPEYDHSKSKKRYSLVRRITISQEMKSNSEYSDDNDDMYESDEFDDSFGACKNVQISDFPRKDSFKTFQSEHIKSNEAYGNVWL